MTEENKREGAASPGIVPRYVLRDLGLDSPREFEERKRRELLEVIAAMGQFRAGCSFVPGYEEHIKPILTHLENLKLEMSSENWGG